LINVYIMYGLGGAVFSGGMESVLGDTLRFNIKNVKCPPARSFTQWKEIVDEIKKQPKTDKTVVIGHSMGAASGTYITDYVPVDLLVLYDLAGTPPSRVGKNTGRCIDIYDKVWDLVPEWRVQAVKGYEDRIVRWESFYGHTGQDDSVDLAKKVISEINKLNIKE
jgi:pimeloyl-ACP methyl ester carboxylesterase